MYEPKDEKGLEMIEVTTPLYTLAYALNPKFYYEVILSVLGEKSPNKDMEVLDGYKKSFKKLCLDFNMRIEFSEFAFFTKLIWRYRYTIGQERYAMY
eukprot:Gb_38773 [translate_table: standard]